MEFEVPLTRGLVALVDSEDHEAVLAIGPWYPHVKPTTTYAFRAFGGSKLYLHRFLLGSPVGRQIDHINGDGLDNRRSNLRLATGTQNQGNSGRRSDNTSGFKGVSWRKDRDCWEVRIQHAGKQRPLGHYRDLHDAARAYDAAARELFGEFARLNFPKELAA